MLIDTKYGALDVEQDGQGRDLVLLHSLLADRTAFDLVRPALAANHRLWLVNLPGYGKSAPRDAGVSVEGYADQIADMMAVLGLPDGLLAGRGLLPGPRRHFRGAVVVHDTIKDRQRDSHRRPHDLGAAVDRSQRKLPWQ